MFDPDAPQSHDDFLKDRMDTYLVLAHDKLDKVFEDRPKLKDAIVELFFHGLDTVAGKHFSCYFDFSDFEIAALKYDLNAFREAFDSYRYTMEIDNR